MTSLVRAAGGVVWRGGEVLVVHRPKYDDWSLPKGKNEPGEESVDAALREVREETGWACALGPELCSVEYVDHLGRPKEVRYWAMTPVAHDLWEPNDEVDIVSWASVDDAPLTYERDRTVLASFVLLVSP